MITPRFNLDQTEKTVSIYIRAPYASLQELDVSIEENVFIFYCAPYYLRIHLPGTLEENENSTSSFNSDSGEFTFIYEKTIYGEHFTDLNFITKLLCPKVEVEVEGHKIEIISSDTSIENLENSANTEYGFALQSIYKFNLNSEFSDVFEVNPHSVKLDERRKIRLQNEKEKFNANHYLSDLFENEEIPDLIRLIVPWKNVKTEKLIFNERELDFLKDMPNVHYNLSSMQVKYCHNSLLDILFAYCYDRRTTYFEGSCESAWNISKISASLSWFDAFLTPKEAVVSAFRRSLIYPLYREFNLSQDIFNDLKLLLQLGEVYIIKCLINIYDIFLSGDRFYILNELFIKDYIIYIMQWDKISWAETVLTINNIKIEKTDLGLNLVQLEEEATYEKLENDMKYLHVNGQTDTSDSDDSETSEYSETDSYSSETTSDD